VTFKNVKRSSAQRIASPSHTQGDLFGGVGGRQAKPSHPRRGGGYLHECTTSNFQKSAGAQKKRDPRLEELQEMGLQRVWLDVAEVIGVDNVIKLWHIPALPAEPLHPNIDRSWVYGSGDKGATGEAALRKIKCAPHHTRYAQGRLT
jgi:hypothetical protein